MVMDKEVSRSSGAGSKRCHDDGGPTKTTTTTTTGNNDTTPMKKKFRTEDEPGGATQVVVTPESNKEWEGRVAHSPRKCRTVRVSVPEGVSIPEGITISVDSPMHSDSDEQPGGPPPMHTLRIHKTTTTDEAPPPQKEAVEKEADVEVEDRSVESLQLEVSGKRKTTMEEEESNDGDEDEDDVPDDNSEGTARILRQIHQSNMERDVSASQQEHARRVRLKMQELLLSQQVATPIVVEEEEETGTYEYVEEPTTTPEPSSAEEFPEGKAGAVVYTGEHQSEEEEVSMMEELDKPAAKVVYQTDSESSMMDMLHNGVAVLMKLIIRLLCFMVMIALFIPVGMEIARLICLMGESDDAADQPEIQAKRSVWEIFRSFRDIPETMIE